MRHLSRMKKFGPHISGHFKLKLVKKIFSEQRYSDYLLVTQEAGMLLQDKIVMAERLAVYSLPSMADNGRLGF